MQKYLPLQFPHEYNYDELPQTVAALRTAFPKARIFTLTGDLGAGKTSLVSEFCRQLGIEEATSSPTFSIVNEYRGNGLVVFHADAYRLKDIEEALDIGFEEYLEIGDYCFIEWPAIIEPMLPSGVVHMTLSHPAPTKGAQLTGGQTRILSLTTPAT